ncbi:MAG TPA: hypothetical protein PLP05_03620 [Sedimentisphaerales bacterium]|nr:hypothetical protein [Sedimentisphaerales bacterium]
MKKYLFSLMLLLAVAAVSFASPYLFSSSIDDWQMYMEGTENGIIEPMDVAKGFEYLMFWDMYLAEGEPFTTKPIQWMPAELYLYESTTPDPQYPEDEGLVMTWLAIEREASYSAGWTFTYGLDPDLSNCTIKISVFAPNWINNVSFWLQDINNNKVSWKWNVPGTIPQNASVQVQINTALIPAGLAAATPLPNSFAIMPGFDITKIVSFGVTENAFVYGNNPIPPVGQPTTSQAWNAWSNLSIIRNDTKAYKGYHVKWSQLPQILPDMFPPMIYGWDQKSIYTDDAATTITMATDDWLCTDQRPITDIHWWGSFIGWTQPYPPAQVPDYFMMCIWTDIQPNTPGPDGLITPYSRPGKLLWTHKCDNWVCNFAGYDVDPRLEFSTLLDPRFGTPQKNEACFQFNQLLSEDSWFRQQGEKNIYWISIAAVYVNTPSEQIRYPWGWKTTPHKNLDVAGVITNLLGQWPPLTPGNVIVSGFFPLILPNPQWYPEGMPFDLAFELTTNKQAPCHGLSADLNHDCVVNFYDFAVFADQWLDTE